MKRRGRGLLLATICIALSAGWLATPIGEHVTRFIAGEPGPGGTRAGERVTVSGGGITGGGTTTTNDLISGGGGTGGGGSGGGGAAPAAGAAPTGELASLDVLKLTLDGLNVLIGLIGLVLAARAFGGARGGG